MITKNIDIRANLFDMLCELFSENENGFFCEPELKDILWENADNALEIMLEDAEVRELVQQYSPHKILSAADIMFSILYMSIKYANYASAWACEAGTPIEEEYSAFKNFDALVAPVEYYIVDFALSELTSDAKYPEYAKYFNLSPDELKTLKWNRSRLASHLRSTAKISEIGKAYSVVSMMKYRGTAQLTATDELFIVTELLPSLCRQFLSELENDNFDDYPWL